MTGNSVKVKKDMAVQILKDTTLCMLGIPPEMENFRPMRSFISRESDITKTSAKKLKCPEDLAMLIKMFLHPEGKFLVNMR